MSKIFNTTNRFDALNDNIHNDNNNNNNNNNRNNNKKNSYKNENRDSKEVNYFKKEEPQQYEINIFGKRRHEKNHLSEKKENKKEYSLEMDHFPDLNTEPLKLNKEDIKKMNFIEKVQNSGKEKLTSSKTNEENKTDDIKPGWVCLYKHPITNHIIWKYGEPISSMLKEDKPNPSDVLDALVETYEKQIAYYDMLWGEGAHERHYKSPYRDYEYYEYFERLDEMYEEMDEEENKRMEIHREDYDEEYYRKY